MHIVTIITNAERLYRTEIKNYVRSIYVTMSSKIELISRHAASIHLPSTVTAIIGNTLLHNTLHGGGN